MANSKAERIKLSMIPNKETGIVRLDSMFVDLMKNILTFGNAFEKEYNEKLVATSIVNIVKGMMGSAYLAGMSSQLYNR